MNWTRDKSLLFSLVCVGFFALALLTLDAGVWWLARTFFVVLRGKPMRYAVLTTVSVYLCSVPAWLTLWSLWRLLGNIRRGEVFVSANVRLLRLVSWCCVWVAAVCLLSAIYYLPFAFIAVAAGFMALVVRIVKNAFQQAIAMKDELDLTV